MEIKDLARWLLDAEERYDEPDQPDLDVAIEDILPKDLIGWERDFVVQLFCNAIENDMSKDNSAYCEADYWLNGIVRGK